MSSDADARQKEVEQNLAFFLDRLPTIPPEQRGRFALIRHRQIVSYYDTAIDAAKAASQLYEDRLYSIQQVVDSAVNLGFFSHAVPLADA